MTIGITELPPEGMQLGGVALAGDSARGTRTTEGLSLLFTTAGITVQGPQPQIERLLVWSGLDSASCHEKVVLPDGRNAAVMELTSGGQSIRFLLPSDTVSPGQAAYLDQALPAWLARYRSAEDHALGLRQPDARSTDSFATASVADLSEQAPPPPPPPPLTQPPPPSQPPPSAPASTGPSPAGAAGAGAAAGAAGAGAAAAGAGAGAAAARAGQPDPGPSSDGNLNGTGAQTGPAPGSESPTSGTGPGSTKSEEGSPAAASPSTPSTSSAGIASPVPAPPGRPPQAGASPSQSPNLAEAAPSTAGAAASLPAPPASGPPGEGAGGTAASSTPAGAASSAGAPPSTPPPVPPPPPAPGTVTWVLSVDPMTPGTEWDNPPLADELAGEGPPKRRWGRRKAKAAFAGGAAVSGAAVSGPVMAGAASPAAPVGPSETPTTVSPSPSPTPTTVSPSQSPTATPSPTPGAGTAASPSPEAGAPAAPASPAPQGRDDRPGDAATTTEIAAAEPTGSEPPAEDRPRRTRLWVLGAALLAVIGAIAYLAASRSNTSSQSTSPVVPPTTARAADGAMVASVNLRLADLPPGWMASSPSSPPLHLPLAGPVTEDQAARTLSACLGIPVATAHGLFAGGPLPGQTAVALSQTFVQGVEPGIQMHSTTTSVASPAVAQADAAVFENPDFLACYGQFERTVAAASVPGATASVQSVTLPPPAGVKSFGYITTVTSPQGSDVFGQAFMIGGRIVTDLMPATNGPQIPSADFTLAYNAIGGRISAEASK